MPLGACPVPVPSWHRAHTASQHASSSVTERVTKSATYVPKPKVKQERGSRDVLLDASPHQAALDDVLPGGASLTMVRQTTTRSRLPSAAGAAGGSGDPLDRTTAAWEAAAEAAREAVRAAREEEGAAEDGAASAKRARHGSETEVRLPPAYAHPVPRTRAVPHECAAGLIITPRAADLLSRAAHLLSRAAHLL